VRRPLRDLGLWLGIVAALGFLLFVYHYLEVLASGGRATPARPFINELTGALVAGLLFFPVRALVLRFPLARDTWTRRLPLYLLGALAVGATATTLMWGLRSLLYPLAGLGGYDYGVMPLRYLMELPLQVVWLTLVVAALHAWTALEAARARELRAAQLAASLARAQVRNLRLQLQPHFLFNALNTISATMYEDPRAADEMLDQLAELLRASLRTAQRDEVPLAEELALLDLYLGLLRARFGERLAVSITVAPGMGSSLVPSLLLQPLVENAIRHGNAERTGRGAVAIRAFQEGHRLVIEVEDDGSTGNAGDVKAGNGGAGTGLGLASTAERLELLYGDDQDFLAGPITVTAADAANTANTAGRGGFRVRVSLPLHSATPEPAEPAA
jgi:two-component system LytT family sensor kinase